MQESKCKVIAITNQKGGVGKTTATFNLGVALAKQEKKVLVVDVDPQSNLTTYVMSREYTLRICLYSIKDDYDYILLDCQPSLGMLTINALAIANTTFKLLNTDTNQYVSQFVGGKVYSEQEKI